MSKSVSRLLILAAAAALVSGCSSNDKAGNCPAVSTLVETSMGTVFRPGAVADPSNVAYTVEISHVHSSCDVDKQVENANTALEIDFRATRAPNGASAHYEVPYFVVIAQADRILAKKIYKVGFDFAPGQGTALFTDSVDSAAVSAARDKKTYDYNILVGLQLTRAQLNYNRATGRYAP